MIHFENIIQIEQPVGHVFAFLANLENLPQWSQDIRSVAHVSGEKQAAGAVYHMIRKEDQQDIKISELEQDQRLVIETIAPANPAWRREIRLEMDWGATKIIDQWMVLDGSPGEEQLAEGRGKLDMKDDLVLLKALLEKGTIPLQDGLSSGAS